MLHMHMSTLSIIKKSVVAGDVDGNDTIESRDSWVPVSDDGGDGDEDSRVRTRSITDHRAGKQTVLTKALSEAVESIPSYIELSSLVLVLVPVCEARGGTATTNYSSWRGRGWCRTFCVRTRRAVRRPRVLATRNHRRPRRTLTTKKDVCFAAPHRYGAPVCVPLAQ